MTKLWTRRVMLAALILILGATEGNSIGLPERWKRAVVFVEYKRLPGKPCLPKTKFDSADEEKTAPEYCPVGSGFFNGDMWEHTSLL